jgi:hypothetical protein
MEWRLHSASAGACASYSSVSAATRTSIRMPVQRPGGRCLRASCAPVTTPLRRSAAVSSKRSREVGAPSEGGAIWLAEAGLSSTERPRSRTEPAWGCQTSPVLEVCRTTRIWLRQRLFGAAGVRPHALRCAQVGTKFGTKFPRVSSQRQRMWKALLLLVGEVLKP